MEKSRTRPFKHSSKWKIVNCIRGPVNPSSTMASILFSRLPHDIFKFLLRPSITFPSSSSEKKKKKRHQQGGRFTSMTSTPLVSTRAPSTAITSFAFVSCGCHPSVVAVSRPFTESYLKHRGSPKWNGCPRHPDPPLTPTLTRGATGNLLKEHLNAPPLGPSPTISCSGSCKGVWDLVRPIDGQDWCFWSLQRSAVMF